MGARRTPPMTTPAWALVGRTDELALIERARRAGEPAIVLTGPAGVGKSRLAREALRLFDQQRDTTRWVQATRSAAAVPLGVFAGVLPDSVRGETTLDLLRAGAQGLRELAGRSRLVLGVDDAHLLDPVSAALVLEVVNQGSVFVVMTVRSGEACPDAVTSVWKDAGAGRVEVGLLDRAQTEALAEEIVGGPVEQSARRWIYETSRGNALYATELTRGALVGGAMTEVHGLWRMAGRPPVTASLGELITARMAGLPARSTQALELLAVGEPFPLDDLIALLGIETFTEVEAAGLVELSAGAAPDASLVHPLFGEVIRAELPPFRRRRIQLELAAAVGRRSAPASARDVMRMARWLAEAGEEVPEEALLKAAETANLAGDPRLGAELAGRAVDAGSGPAAVLVLARSHVLEGRSAEAGELLAGAEGVFGAGRATLEQAVEYLDLQTSVLYWGLRRTAELTELLGRARLWFQSAEWHRQVERLSLIGHDETSPVTAASVSAGIYGDEDAGTEVRRRTAPVLAANLFYSGRVREAHQLISSIRPAVPLRDLTEELTVALWVGITLDSGLGWTELDGWAQATLAEGIRLGDHAAAGTAALGLGGLRFSQGRYREAARWLAEAELQLEGRDHSGLLAVVNSMQVGVAWSTGEPDAAAPALRRCLAAIGADEPLPGQLPYVARARAWAVLADGDRPRAQALFLEAADRLTEVPVFCARLTYEAHRAGAPAGRLVDSLRSLAGRSDGPLTAAYASHIGARAASDADALLGAADEMEAIGALRYAAEAAADAASVFAAAGRQDSARRAAARCRALHPEDEGGSLPAMPGLEPGEIALTARERQLVDLAGRGLTNVEIADRLVLSVRTVESHLYRAMAKLGVDDRRRLRAPGRDG